MKIHQMIQCGENGLAAACGMRGQPMVFNPARVTCSKCLQINKTGGEKDVPEAEKQVEAARVALGNEEAQQGAKYRYVNA